MKVSKQNYPVHTVENLENMGVLVTSVQMPCKNLNRWQQRPANCVVILMAENCEKIVLGLKSGMFRAQWKL